MYLWKISSRLRLLIGVSVLVMLMLLVVNWVGMTRLAQLQDDSYKRTQDAGQLRQDAGIGAQGYRIVADTLINRQFAESASKWQAMSAEIDKALDHAAKAADTPEERQLAQDGSRSMTEFRELYVKKYLPMVQGDAPVAEIAAVDDQIDKLLDRFSDSFGKLAASMQGEANQADEEFDATAQFTRAASIISVAIGGLVLVGLALLISRSITGQLGMELSDAMTATQRIAQGDLSGRINTNSANRDSLAANLTRMLETLQSTVTRVRSGAEGVSTASSEIAQGNQDLSSRTENQASALEETAASMEQLSVSVKQNADSASQANQMARNASTVAIKGGDVVAQVVETMKGINDSSRRIADIISVVDGIAFQTNILALNAAVEAARAGEQGRGFAVVASEVRSLAGRSADAAKEIKALINASVERVEQGTVLVDQAGATMTEVVNAIQRVTDLMGEISSASREQSAGVSQVGEAVTQMDQVTQQNAALVEEMAAATSNLRSQAQDLVQTVEVFDLGIDKSGSPVRPIAVRARLTEAVTDRSDGQRTAQGSVDDGTKHLGINLDNAIKAHADWRQKLRTAATRQEKLDAKTISRDDCCEMGKWLHGSGGTKFGGEATFMQLIKEHKDFHSEAGKVAGVVNQGDGEKAVQMLGSGTGFARTSNEVSRLIVQLKRETGRTTQPLPRPATQKVIATMATATQPDGDWESF